MIGDNEDQNHGIAAALRSMEMPLRQIVTNAGDEASVVVDKVKQGSGNFGYNAATDEYSDMLDMGILDPAKVTRTALQAAASIAGLMITTEAMVAELPEDKPAAPDYEWYGWHGRHDVSQPSQVIPKKAPQLRGFFLAVQWQILNSPAWVYRQYVMLVR